MADGKYKCHDCHMTFDSTQLLQKHKKKFCVGGNIGDPDNLLLRRGLWSAGTPSPPPQSPDVRKVEKKEYQKYNPNQDSQLRQLAENHGRQMEYLQIKNRDLEKQREDIRRRLEELGKKGSKPQPSDNTSQLLSELRAQEERNKLALEDLRRQLYDIHGQRLNFIEVEKSGQPQPPPAPDRKSYVYPVYYGNSLVAEISAMRQAYLQNGGNDPDVLAQMAQMQAEAQNIEDGLKQVPDKKEKKDHHGQLQMLEMENERLHKELMLLQEQNFLNRKKSDREDELEGQLRRLQEEQLRKMLQLQNEIELLKQQNLLKQTARLPPPAPNNADMPWMMQRPYVDVEPMQPYDQYPNRYVPTAHHTWVSTQHSKTSRPPPTARPGPINDIEDPD